MSVGRERYAGIHAVLTLVFPLTTQGQQAPQSAPHLEPCDPLSEADYNAQSVEGDIRKRFPTFAAYRRYRASIEVIDYDALSSTANPLVRVPRNVTDQDDVYLRLRGNTFHYTYQASWTASDLTTGDLLNVIGASPNQAMFGAEAAEDAAGAAAKNAAATDEAKRKTAAASATAGGAPEDRQLRDLGRAGRVRHAQAGDPVARRPARPGTQRRGRWHDAAGGACQLPGQHRGSAAEPGRSHR